MSDDVKKIGIANMFLPYFRLSWNSYYVHVENSGDNCLAD